MFISLKRLKKIQVSHLPGPQTDKVWFNSLAVPVPHGKYDNHSNGSYCATAEMIYPNGMSITLAASVGNISFEEFLEETVEARKETGWILIQTIEASVMKSIQSFALEGVPSAVVAIASVAVQDLYEGSGNSFITVEVDPAGAVKREQSSAYLDPCAVAASIVSSI